MTGAWLAPLTVPDKHPCWLDCGRMATVAVIYNQQCEGVYCPADGLRMARDLNAQGKVPA